MQTYLDRLPLIAILRGVAPDNVVAVGQALVDAGFSIIEVPLNSPSPMESIGRLHSVFGDAVLVGAGTVTTPAQVANVADAGGRLIVMPHTDARVIRAAKALAMTCMAGVATPTDGFAALHAGADALKLFPAELLTPAVLRALRSVFPADTRCFPVGGITPEAMKDYVAAGATGFGLGSALYRKGDSAEQVGGRARTFVEAWSALS